MTIQAPYRFVPLSSLVVLPDWAEQVSQDVPFKDGICGELEVEITTHGKVCVGGKQQKDLDISPTQVEFYKTPDGKPAIPGSSLKGMLRNVLEIATFSRFKQVEDQKLGVRDIRNSGNFYHSKIQNPEAGWLRFEDGTWKIYPCNFARLHQQDLISCLGLTYESWARENNKKIRQRYNLIGINPNIQFEENGQNKQGQILAIPSRSKNAINGKIVVTGQPGQFYRNNKKAKKYEFIFYDEFSPLDVDPEVVSGFHQIYEDTDEWLFWRENSERLSKGIPVFFHCATSNKEKVISFGLSMMYKLPYENSIYEAIRNTDDLHVDDLADYDLSDLIFGTIDENGENSLRGRVNIGLASVCGNVDLKPTQAMVLNSPKATYYPFYIAQNSQKNEFSQLMQEDVKLSGWKRYPIKNEKIYSSAESRKVESILEVVPKNTLFKTKIRFHNLKPIELGALLWAIDFGKCPELRHGLGHGKPYGLGSVQLSVKQSHLRLNDPSQNITINLDLCRQAFIDYMEKQIGSNFESLEPIKALLKYAQPNSEDNLNYMPLEDFATYKDPKKYKDKVMNTFFEFSGIQGKKKIVIKVEDQEKLVSNILSKKPKNSQETDEIYLLAEIEKSSHTIREDQKILIAKYLETKYKDQNKWKEQSSSNKAERKLYDQTQRIKRFLG
jgi:CRISPR-associated protein (TIGR03986 family)